MRILSPVAQQLLDGEHQVTVLSAEARRIVDGHQIGCDAAGQGGGLPDRGDPEPAVRRDRIA